MESLIAGYRCEAWKAELLTLEARQAELKAILAAKPLPALHPKMAEIYREKAAALAAGLEHDEQRDAARLALRGFLEKIIIPHWGRATSGRWQCRRNARCGGRTDG